MSLIMFLTIFCTSFSMITFHKNEKFMQDAEDEVTAAYQFLNQKLDHFSSNTRTFSQRYVVNEEFYNGSQILIVYISGEGTLSSRAVDSGSGFQTYLAQQYGALIASLEHRFYGQSIPDYGSCGQNCLNLTNLQYLSSEQALSDLAVFIEYLKAGKYNSLDIQKVIVVGGSYAGAMAAWFRSLYPDVADAALASSGPVLADEDFYQYDQSVAAGLNDETCAQNIRLGVNASDSEIDQDFATVKRTLNCTTLGNPDDVRYALADAVAYAIQYNKEEGSDSQRMRRNLCAIMNGRDTPSQKYYQFFNSLLKNLSTNCAGFADSREVLSQTTAGGSGRQWYWQSCREFGYFQTAPAVNPLRSPRIDLAYHHDLCAYIFNESFSVPDTDATNALYGGLNPAGTQIDFTNGELDPWHMLSIYPDQPTDTSRDQTWGIYMVKGGSHCNDLVQPRSSTWNEDIGRVQNLVDADLRSWIGVRTPSQMPVAAPVASGPSMAPLETRPA